MAGNYIYGPSKEGVKAPNVSGSVLVLPPPSTLVNGSPYNCLLGTQIVKLLKLHIRMGHWEFSFLTFDFQFFM